MPAAQPKPSRLILPPNLAACAWDFQGKSIMTLGNDGWLTFDGGNRRRASGSMLCVDHARRRIATADRNVLHVYSADDLAQESIASLDGRITTMAWSPDGKKIAVLSSRGDLRVLRSKGLRQVFPAFVKFARQTSWAPLCWRDDSTVVSTVNERSLSSLEITAAADIPYSAGHSTRVSTVSRSPSGEIVSSSHDGSLRVWDSLQQSVGVLESPTGTEFLDASVVRYSGQTFIAGCGLDGSVALYHLEAMRLVTTLSAPYLRGSLALGFSPDGAHLGFVTESRQVAYVWDTADLISGRAVETSSRYRNAKVVLVGDSGVGKSGLAFPLSGRKYKRTDSTHGRKVWTAQKHDVEVGDGQTETRETLLWDLAGQPGYRLFHRLSLRDVAVGLVVFDSRHETDPFRGVSYWARCLDESAGAPKLTKLLVAARTDRGGPRVSEQRIQQCLEAGGFAAYFETSARTGRGITELLDAIRDAIEWDGVPIIVAPAVFAEIRAFLVRHKERGLLLAAEAELRSDFEEHAGAVPDPQVFRVCLQRLEAAGLVAKVSVGDTWLLQPELLDNYAAWLSQAARREPDGLGAIKERDALTGAYEHDALDRASDEQLMLLTAAQEVVGRGLAVRVDTEEGQILVFPSELRTDLPDHPGEYQRELSFTFTGPVAAIYAAITVRLVNSLTYGHDYTLFHNAALFRPAHGDHAEYGFLARYPQPDDEAAGEFVVFFGGTVQREHKLTFIRYIDYQLQQMAIEGTVARNRIYSCCGAAIPPYAVERRRENGETTVICPVCGRRTPMDDLAEAAHRVDQSTVDMHQQAVGEQERQKRLTAISTREAAGSVDAFLFYNTADRPTADHLRTALRNEGVLTWMDIHNLRPGDRVTAAIETTIDTVGVALMAVGPHSLGPWQQQEYYSLLHRAVTHREGSTPLRLVPILLPGAEDIDALPAFARNHAVVDLRETGIETSALRPLVEVILRP